MTSQDPPSPFENLDFPIDDDSLVGALPRKIYTRGLGARARRRDGSCRFLLVAVLWSHFDAVPLALVAIAKSIISTILSCRLCVFI